MNQEFPKNIAEVGDGGSEHEYSIESIFLSINNRLENGVPNIVTGFKDSLRDCFNSTDPDAIVEEIQDRQTVFADKMSRLSQDIRNSEKEVFSSNPLLETAFRTYIHDLKNKFLEISGRLIIKIYGEADDGGEISKPDLGAFDGVDFSLSIDSLHPVPYLVGKMDLKDIFPNIPNSVSYQNLCDGEEKVLVNNDLFKATVKELINNALSAISPDTGKIIVTTKTEDEYFVVEVEDNGHGIPEDILKKIFEHGFTTKKERGGTGLGLSLAHECMEHWGGSLDVKSSDQGTTFTIKLPLLKK